MQLELLLLLSSLLRMADAKVYSSLKLTQYPRAHSIAMSNEPTTNWRQANVQDSILTFEVNFSLYKLRRRRRHRKMLKSDRPLSFAIIYLKNYVGIVYVSRTKVSPYSIYLLKVFSAS